MSQRELGLSEKIICLADREQTNSDWRMALENKCLKQYKVVFLAYRYSHTKIQALKQIISAAESDLKINQDIGHDSSYTFGEICKNTIFKANKELEEEIENYNSLEKQLEKMQMSEPIRNAVIRHWGL